MFPAWVQPGARHSRGLLLLPRLAPPVLEDWLLGPRKSSRRSWDLQHLELCLVRLPSLLSVPWWDPAPNGNSVLTAAKMDRPLHQKPCRVKKSPALLEFP